MWRRRGSRATTEPTSGYRPEFEAALRLFARASAEHVANGYEAPILVGGGAAELFTGSSLVTGDFDIVTARQEAFEEVLRSVGFVQPSGRGRATRGWVHPDLMLGFEIVSSTLLAGRADRDRVRLIDMGQDGIASVVSVEDLIADRMGQYASGSAAAMLGQARELLALHGEVDLVYLERRIREETIGDYGVEDVSSRPV